MRAFRLSGLLRCLPLLLPLVSLACGPEVDPPPSSRDGGHTGGGGGGDPADCAAVAAAICERACACGDGDCAVVEEGDFVAARFPDAAACEDFFTAACGLADIDPAACVEAVADTRCDAVVAAVVATNECSADDDGPVCGNGYIEPPEECDPPGTSICDDNCRALPYCGDGDVQGDEECDDGNFFSGDGCSGCVLDRCGDGFVSTANDEACDDGNEDVGDGCRPDCTVEACGDGIVDPNEQCDDENREPGDGCSPSCTLELCGDGVLDGTEPCDDGNLIEGDFCTSQCLAGPCQDGLHDPSERCWLHGVGSAAQQLDATEFVVRDIDGDGRPEILAIDDHGLLVSRLDVPGVPRVPKRYLVPEGVRTFAAGDLNGDGDDDAVLLKGGLFDSPFQLTVEVRLQDDAGDFPEGASFDVGNVLETLSLADFDGDGNLDLVELARGELGFAPRIRLGDGAGAFGEPLLLAEAGAVNMGVGDLDDDGDEDIVTFASGQRAFFVYWNEGGTFSAPLEVSLGTVPTSVGSRVLVGDLDGDGRSEILGGASAGGGDQVLVLRHGDTSLEIDEIASPSAYLQELADVDDDGDLDVLVSVSFFPHVLVNDGAGNLSDAGPLPLGVQVVGPMRAADLDGDGNTDLVLANNGLHVLLQRDGALLSRYTTPMPAGPAVPIDLDGDGDLDVVGPAEGGGLGAYFNDGTGWLRAAALPGGDAIDAREGLVAAALDEDDATDLAALTAYPAEVYVLRSGGDGAMTATALGIEDDLARHLTSGDLDGDGDVDLAYLANHELVPLLNDGSGGFTTGSRVNVMGSGIVSTLQLRDLNGDGAADVVLATDSLWGGGLGDVRITLSDGNGGFGAPARVQQIAAGVRLATVAHVDDDTNLDLVVGFQDGTETVHVLFGNGDGTFSAPTPLPTDLPTVDDLLVVDLNLDGRADIVATSLNDDHVAFLYQDALGGFSLDAKLRTYRYQLHRVMALDLNADALPDVAFSGNSEEQLQAILSAP